MGGDILEVRGLDVELSLPVSRRLSELPWVPSPRGTVERRMLEREEAESGRATSVVRYRAGSHFPEHRHDGGEEFVVLAGTFLDEHGAYPAGSYVRNPVGSRHAPFSDEGCVLFVKLWQMHEDQTERVVLDTQRAREISGGGVERLPLYEDGHERVTLLRAREPTQQSWRGAELFLLEGALTLDGERFESNAWIRRPSDARLEVRLEAGAVLYVKEGHLP